MALEYERRALRARLHRQPGGLIKVFAELPHFDHQSVATLVEGIGSAMGQILDAADRHGSTPLAEALALRRLRVGARPAVRAIPTIEKVTPS